MIDYKEELLQLLKRYAYKKGEYTLSSGKKTGFYINCKPVTLSGRGLTLASLLLLRDINTQYVAGLTLGADPLVSGVSIMSALDGKLINGLIMRKEPKGHGTEAWLEGQLPPLGTYITVLEDVTTTGGSALKVVNKLRESGYEVNKVVTLVNRKEGAGELLVNNDVKLYSVYAPRDFDE